MRVSIIGWGSLIWRPEVLQIESRWRRDGPSLPIEFARISGDGKRLSSQQKWADAALSRALFDPE
jgi:hypothetical protein